MILKQSTAYIRTFLMVQSADHVSALTGAAPVVKLSKAGAAAVTATNSPATEIDSTNAPGWYKISLTTTDTNTLGELAYHCTAASGDPTDFVDQVQVQVFTDVVLDANGNVSIASSIKKNQTAILPFVMTQSGVPTAGLTVTAQRSLGGAGFAPCANAVTDTGNGTYVINLAATDTNAAVIMFRFTAVNSDDRDIVVYTQP